MINFICPICKLDMHQTTGGCTCANGHNFDKSKEGYFNLLLSSNKNSKDPGDNKEMVHARNDFLSLNTYEPLAVSIANIINEYSKEPITILDAGVGTGYYINKISSIRTNKKDTLLGIDISKSAVKIAAKHNKSVECVVGSVFDLPYKDNSIDVITCIFSPYAMDEYERILKDTGILIIASPKESHLIELRKLLYKDVREVENSMPIKNFSILKKEEVTYSFELSSKQDISNILTMTPYVYRAPKESVEKVRQLDRLALTASFDITVLKKPNID